MQVPASVLNEALAAYIQTFPVEERLDGHLASQGRQLETSHETIKQECRAIVKTASDFLGSYPGGVPWTRDFLTEYRDALAKTYPWLDDTGFAVIRRFSEWLCWHDGLNRDG